MDAYDIATRQQHVTFDHGAPAAEAFFMQPVLTSHIASAGCDGSDVVHRCLPRRYLDVSRTGAARSAWYTVYGVYDRSLAPTALASAHQ